MQIYGSMDGDQILKMWCVVISFMMADGIVADFSIQSVTFYLPGGSTLMGDIVYNDAPLYLLIHFVAHAVQTAYCMKIWHSW